MLDMGLRLPPSLAVAARSDNPLDRDAGGPPPIPVPVPMLLVALQTIATATIRGVELAADVLTQGGLVLGVDVGDVVAVNALAGACRCMFVCVCVLCVCVCFVCLCVFCLFVCV